jgi:hypothetical protein
LVLVLNDRIASIAQFSLEVCEQLIVQGEFSLQRPIGYPPMALQ